jgi:peptide/nickel transport system permease protein
MKAESVAKANASARISDLFAALDDGWRRLVRNKLSFLSICVILGLVVVAVFAPWIAPFDPDEPDAMAILQAPDWVHWLGTDEYGRDQLSRIIVASRVDLLVPFASTFAALVLGSLIGAVSGYRGGWIDQLVMRCVDAVMAFPAFILAMGLAAAMGNSVTSLTIVIAVTQAPVYLRQLRADMVRVRELEYAEAAKAVGNPPLRIVFVHLFPNCFPPLIVQATLSMGFALLTLAALSYIGLGVQPPDSEWGQMTSEGASLMVTGEWWLSLFPGLAILLTVLVFNLVGDGLRDVLDPKMRGIR